MSPNDFETLAKTAFDKIKVGLGTKEGDALYEPKAGGSIAIRGVFDDRIQEVDPDTERIISSNRFTFGINLNDIPAAPVKGDIVKIKGVSYKVIESREDGVQGVSAELILHKVT